MIPTGFDNMGVRLDLLIIGWIGCGLLVVAIGFAVLALWLDSYTADLPWALSGIAGVIGAILGTVWICMMIPFDGAYQHDYRVTGHVLDVSNVLSDASGDLTRTPVLTLDSVDRPLVVDDPRAIATKGYDVVLKCNVQWHFRAADSYSCKVIDFGGAK